jgi:hypothetical protein
MTLPVRVSVISSSSYAVTIHVLFSRKTLFQLVYRDQP